MECDGITFHRLAYPKLTWAFCIIVLTAIGYLLLGETVAKHLVSPPIPVPQQYHVNSIVGWGILSQDLRHSVLDLSICLLVIVDYVISHHTRTCNRITFHYSDSNLLLTGSQDGSVALVVRQTYLLTFSDQCWILLWSSDGADHGVVKMKYGK